MPVTVGDIYAKINEIAPFEAQAEWDNAGLLAGSADAAVDTVLVALELNPNVLEEAEKIDAQLIVTHHPILFRGRKNLREDDPEGCLLCALVRSGIALIAAHTNYDEATPGVNDALADALDLTDVEILEEGVRVGTPKQNTLGAFRTHVENTLDGAVRMYGEADAKIGKVGILGGAGGDYAEIAQRAGADVFLTGEISHHRAWDAYLAGMCVLEAGHAATELPAIHFLAEGLQKAADDVKWNLRIYESKTELFK